MHTFSFYLTENRLYIYYNSRSVNFVQAVITGYCDSHTQHMNTLCGQNAEFWGLNLMVHITATKLSRVNGGFRYMRVHMPQWLLYAKRIAAYRAHRITIELKSKVLGVSTARADNAVG
jgi:hypothetical protein